MLQRSHQTSDKLIGNLGRCAEEGDAIASEFQCDLQWKVWRGGEELSEYRSGKLQL